MRVLVAVLTIALAAVALCQDDSVVGSLPENPHQSLYIEGMCTVCHDTDREGAVEPHVFVLPIMEICMRESCHTAEKIGRSHPVGVNARHSQSVQEVPEFLPLESDDMISCGSCHEPHGEWLSATRCYPKQEPEVFLTGSAGGEESGTPLYKTYYLRVPGDPNEGFTELCISCHPR